MVYLQKVAPKRFSYMVLHLKQFIFGITSIFRNRDDLYCFLYFSINLKIMSLISPHLIGVLSYSKCKQEKTLIQFMLLQGENFYSTLLSIFQEKRVGSKTKTASNSFLVKRKERSYQQNRILLFKLLKTLNRNLYLKPNLAKSQQWIRYWIFVKGYTEKQHATSVCFTIKK